MPPQQCRDGFPPDLDPFESGAKIYCHLRLIAVKCPHSPGSIVAREKLSAPIRCRGTGSGWPPAFALKPEDHSDARGLAGRLRTIQDVPVQLCCTFLWLN